MLSKKAIEELKKSYSFEEIQRISNSLDKIESWKIFSKEEARAFIDNEIFSKYWVNV